MRTRALLSTTWLILGLLFTAADPPSERTVSKYTSTARAKSISFQEDGDESDPGFHGVFPGFGVTSSSFSAAMSAAGSTSNSANKRWIFTGRRWMRAPALFHIRPMT
jgi:hypothetical protein